MNQTVTAKSAGISTDSRSHRRLATFVKWIKPEQGTREKIFAQATSIRKNISAQAANDGLEVIATPESGSFAKHTGLRKHMRKGVEIEGLDVDLPFVVQPVTEEGERIQELLRRFEEYARASYPDTPRQITGSSVELTFAASGLRYDLVPMLISTHKDHQIILKKDGTRRLTSVQKHTEFVSGRTSKSDDMPGVVRFNDAVRLVKWWRCVQISGSQTIEEVRTTLIELLCAFAFDHCGVAPTYTETLAKWFTLLASVVARQATVSFNDYPTIEHQHSGAPGNPHWRVIDPVNVNNNVVHQNWGRIEISEFASWFASGRDALNRIIAHERMGTVSTVDDLLVQIFGNPVITHGELS